MEFLIFIGVVFLIAPIQALLTGVLLRVQDPNCPEDVNNVRSNKAALIGLTVSGIVLITLGLLL